MVQELEGNSISLWIKLYDEFTSQFTTQKYKQDYNCSMWDSLEEEGDSQRIH